MGNAAYKLQLPHSVQIHPVFHVSQLKKHVGPQAIPSANVPMLTTDGYIKSAPDSVLSTRAVPNGMTVKTQWLIRWVNLSDIEAMWEDTSFIQSTFPSFYYSTLKSWFPEKYP